MFPCNYQQRSLQNMSWKSLIIVDNARFQFPRSAAELSATRVLIKRGRRQRERIHSHSKEGKTVDPIKNKKRVTGCEA